MAGAPVPGAGSAMDMSRGLAKGEKLFGPCTAIVPDRIIVRERDTTRRPHRPWPSDVFGADTRCRRFFAQAPIACTFFSHEPNEPPHVQVDRDDATCKFWLDPIALASSFGFSPSKLRRIHRLVSAHQVEFWRQWHDYFDA